MALVQGDDFAGWVETPDLSLVPHFPEPVAGLGDTVLYRLNTQDTLSIGDEIRRSTRRRARVVGGEDVPAIVVRVHEDGSVNLRLILDGGAMDWFVARVTGPEIRPGRWWPKP